MSASSKDCLTTYDAVGEACDIGRCSSGTPGPSSLRSAVCPSVGSNLLCWIRSGAQKNALLWRSYKLSASGMKLSKPQATSSSRPSEQADRAHVTRLPCGKLQTNRFLLDDRPVVALPHVLDQGHPLPCFSVQDMLMFAMVSSSRFCANIQRLPFCLLCPRQISVVETFRRHGIPSVWEH